MGDVFEIVSQEQVWAGGAARLPDGWEIVYQRNEDFGSSRMQSVARARHLHGSLKAPTSMDPEETVAGTALTRAYDPGVVAFAKGQILMASWDAGAIREGVHISERTGEGEWTDNGIVSTEDMHAEAEATLQRCGGRTLLIYSVQVSAGDRWTIVSRRLSRGAWGDPVTIGTQSGAGPSDGIGTRGEQKRVTAVRRNGGYLAAWGDGDPGQARGIRLASSADAEVWADEGIVARISGQDLVNPFLLGDDGAALGVLAVVVSNPGGLYLMDEDGHLSKPTLPKGIKNVSRPVCAVEDGELVCFAAFAYSGRPVLGTFVIPTS